jgi:very-short-patch-repair endonuclease
MIPRKLNSIEELKPLRKRLRRALTPAEAALWNLLGQSKLHGRKFRRQHSIGPYVVDFYCVQERLVIELDGAAHDSERRVDYDRDRTKFLEKLGLRIVRIENREVFDNPDGLLAYIAQQFRNHPGLAATPP